MKRMMTMVLSAALLFTACTDQPEVSEQDITQEHTSSTEPASGYDPFAPSDNDTASGSVGSFSFGVEWEDGKEFVLDYASTVSFRYYVDNSGKAADFGLLLFVNGFRQPYRTKEQTANSVLHYFDVGQNEHKIQTIEFEPIVGEKGDVLSVEILSMFCPSYIQTESSQYTFNHKIASLYPSRLQVTQNTGLSEPKVCSEYEVTPITQELRQEFNQMNAKGEYGGNALDNGVYIETLKNDVFYTPADRLNAESDITPFTMQDSVTLCMYGGASCQYRVSMYLNHELIPGAFDGADYIDITPSKDSICKKEIDLEALSLPLEEYNHLYFIAVPFYTNQNYGERMVLKSATVTLKGTE